MEFFFFPSGFSLYINKMLRFTYPQHLKISVFQVNLLQSMHNDTLHMQIQKINYKKERGSIYEVIQYWI